MEHPDWALPARHRIAQVELQGVVHVGSAGVLYRGWDHALSQSVAVEEFLPHGLARRLGNGHVDAVDDGSRGAFELGRQAFCDKARTLARCEHPSLLRVLHLLQANGTAYSVMPWYSGRPMLDAIGPEQPLPEVDLRSLMADLLGALHAYHRHGGLHGDLRPAKVLLLDDGHGLLLGPDGAAGTLAARPAAEPFVAGGPAPLGPQGDLQAMALLAQWCMGCASPAERLGVGIGAHRVRRSVEAQYSPAFRQWLESPFASDPNERPLSAAQFRHWLLQLPERPAEDDSAELQVALLGATQRAREPASAAATMRHGAASQALAVPVAEMDLAVQHEPPPLRKAASRTLGINAPKEDVASLGSRAAGPAHLLFDTLDSQGPVAARPHRWRLQLAGLLAAVVMAASVAAWIWWERGGATAPQRNALAVAMAPTGAPAAAPLPPAAAVRAVADPASAAPPAPAPAEAASVPPVDGAATTASLGGRDAPGAAPPLAGIEPPASTIAPAAARAAEAEAPSRAPAAQTLRATIDTPRVQCGDRTEFSLYRCMQQQCAKPRWQSHADCVRFRQTDGVS